MLSKQLLDYNYCTIAFNYDQLPNNGKKVTNYQLDRKHLYAF